MEEEILASNGQEDPEFVLNEASENPITTSTAFRGSNDDCIPDIEGIELGLPDDVSVTTTAKPGDDSYFTVTIDGVEGIPVWCADQDLSLEVDETATFQVFSSYENITHGVFENPQNFDKVNWLLNQDLIGTESPGYTGEYTFGHVQYTIWLSVDDSVCVQCLFLTEEEGQWGKLDINDVEKAEELAGEAMDNGAGFVPQCGEKIAIVLAS